MQQATYNKPYHIYQKTCKLQEMGRSLGQAGYDVVWVIAVNKITSVRIGSCVCTFNCTQYFIEEKAAEAQVI